MPGRFAVRAALLLAVLAFVPGLLDPFMATKAALLRAAGFGLIAWAIAGGGARAPGAAERALLAALAVLAASTALAASPALALRGEIEQREGLLTWLAVAGLFVGAVRSHTGAESRERTLDAIVLAASLAAGYALVQFAGFDPFAWSGAATYTGAGAGVLRPGSTLGNPILLGAVLAPALAIVTARLAAGRGDRSLLAAVAAVLACTLAATLSRGAWIAGAAGFVVSVALVRPAWPRLAIALGAPLLPALAWSAVALRGAPLARLTEGAAASSAPARLAIASAALRLWRERPWLGTGPDGFGLAFPRVQPLEYWQHLWLGMPAHAHSAPLQLLATTGALGVLALAVWAALALRPLATASGSRAGANEAAGEWGALAALAAAALFNPLGLAGAAVLVTLLALAAAREARPASAPKARARAALVAVALVALAASVPELRDLGAAGRARAALEGSLALPEVERPSVMGAALRAADDAVRHGTRDDGLWRLASDARLAAARAGGTVRAPELAQAAELAAREAIALQPSRASNRLRLADALAVRAHLDPGRRDALVGEAFAEYDAAAALAPADALVLVNRARAALQLDRAPDALASARAMIRMYPAAATGHALEGAALLALGRRDEAREALGRALAAEWEEGSEQQRRAAASLHEALGRP
ncbi:MAG: O-antigen ligase family protein [Candidatus Eisenbacteria bacterium]|nr:O-antigen ligase family protein [Candidatus Eisenbacteria bacterium]